MRDLRSLETVIWVVRLGGFRAAAARLNTTQSAVSARVAQLERELGIRIFQRGARVTLTAEGSALLRYAEQMVDLREEMLRAIADPAAMRGLLRIGISETLAHTLLPRLVHAWNMVQKTRESLTESPAVTAKRFYYDNVLFDADSVKFLINRFGAGQVLVGSDYPFALGEQDPIGRLRQAGLDENTVAQIGSANAKRFLGL